MLELLVTIDCIGISIISVPIMVWCIKELISDIIKDCKEFLA